MSNRSNGPAERSIGPVGPHGGTKYMPGAEPFELAGGDAGILLMHGFSGSCSEMRAIGNLLHSRGFGVIAPALAGHGTTPGDLINVTPEDFFATAEDAYHKAAQCYKRVYLIGLSMGGSLALRLATRHPVAGLVTISAPVFMSKLVAWSVPVAKHWMPRHNVISNYAAWRGEVVGYRSTPLSSLSVFLDVLATVKSELPRVSAPMLVIHSIGDQTVPVANAPFIMSRVASSEKAVRIYRGGRHLLTLPPHLDSIESDITHFLRSQEARYVTDAAAASEGAQG